MRNKDSFLTILLTFLIILVFLVTIYFCLDMFGIIEVPKKYSIASFLGENLTNLYADVDLEEIVTNDTIDEWINAKPKVVDNPIERDSGYKTAEISTIPIEQEEGSEVSNNSDEGVVTNTTNRMYFSQLDAYGKLIYLQFIEHKDELITGTYVADFGTSFNDLLHEDNGNEILEKSFQFSINSLMFDNPELFYIDITKIYMSTEVLSLGPLKTYRVKIGPAEGTNYLSDFFQNQEWLISTNNALENFRNNFVQQTSVFDDYTKVKKAHDYIIENTEYDQNVSKNNIYNIYGVLMQHSAVCEGYSKTLKYILDAANVPCVIACGIAKNSNGQTESHAWNYVKLNDKWYAIDSTWDDPVIIGNGYISSSIYSKYFLKGSNEFFRDHLEDGNIVNNSNFVYPTISEENYSK